MQEEETKADSASAARAKSANSRLTKRFFRLSGFGFVVLVAGILLWLLRPQTPEGTYDATIVANDRPDLRLVFYGGQVTVEGTEGPPDSMGEYRRSIDGMWLWETGHGNEWVMQPGWVGIHCAEVSNPTNVFFLKRRIF